MYAIRVGGVWRLWCKHCKRPFDSPLRGTKYCSVRCADKGPHEH
jgi:hypothetical protein